MTASEAFPTPGVEITHLLVVADAEVSRRWYESVLGADLHRAYGGTSVVLKMRASRGRAGLSAGPAGSRGEVSRPGRDS